MAKTAFNTFTYKDVENILAQALGIMTNNTLDSYQELKENENINSIVKTNIKTGIINHIDEMIRELKERVNKCFPKENGELTNFITYYNNWREAFSDKFNSFSSFLDENYVFNANGVLSAGDIELKDNILEDYNKEEVYPILTNYLKSNDFLGKISSKTVTTGQFGKITLEISNIDKNKLTSLEGFVGKGSSIKVEYKYDEKNNKMIVSFKNTDRRNKFLQRYQAILFDEEYQKLLETPDSKKIINSINKIEVFKKNPIIEYFANNKELGNYFVKGLDKVGNDISITASKSGFMGAIGEAYWYGFFYYLASKGCQTAENYVQAVGTSLKSNAGQEVPIDIIFKNMGIQVKNLSYATVEPKRVRLTSQSNQKMNSFLSNPGLGNAGLASNEVEILGKFFFTANYNKPNFEKFSGPSLDKYNNLYSYVKAAYDEKITFLTSLLPRIISIDKNLQINMKDNIEEQIENEKDDLERIYANMPDLFIINDKLYYSVDLLEDLKKVIQKDYIDKNDVIMGDAFEFTNVKFNVTPFEEAPEGHIYDYPMEVDVDELMKKSTVSFSLYFNFNIPDINGEK